MRSGGCAGSGRALRLDPSGLPVRFLSRRCDRRGKRARCRTSSQACCRAASAARHAHGNRGLRWRLLWLVPGEGGDALAVVLKHRDPTLTLPLFMTSRSDEALAEWRAWSLVLNVPLLFAEHPGSSPAASAHLDHLHVERPRPRRRRRSALKARRPSVLLRRGTGKVTRAAPVDRGEREIIARN